MFYEGRQIGNYTLLRKLGKGGFGEVWLAEKRSQFVTKKVAVKLPLDEQVNLDAIHQEAELWEQASGHANVLPIIDADIIDGQVVIVSEYADGGSLADKLKRDGKLPLQKAVEMTIGILSGLEFLHNRKIIHRDIKPQNILLQGETPRLADFGISRAMNTTVVSSAIIGTDAYMSPESFDGKRNVQTDIWSVGVVLYALLTDRLPFPQEHPSERMFAILTKEFEPLPPEVPQNLQRIVYKALAKQPENRYQTTGEMRVELQKALLGIAHPTFAPTEVFRIPNENLPTLPTLENKHETGESEKETIVNQKNVNLPAPTQSSFPPESVVTNLKAAPPVTNEPAFSPTLETNKPHGAQFQMSAHQIPDKTLSPVGSVTPVKEKSNEIKFFAAVIGALMVILAISFFYSKNSSVVSNNANLANVSATNTSTSSSFPLKIELKTRNTVLMDIYIDGKNESSYASSPVELKFTAYQSFRFGFPRLLKDDVQIKINDKAIIPIAPSNDGTQIWIEITKDNYDRVFLTGSNTGQIIVNASSSNTVSNSAANSVSNTSSETEMKIELESSIKRTPLLYTIDSNVKIAYLNPGEVLKLSPARELRLTYSKDHAKSLTLRINGKTISIPTIPNPGNPNVGDSIQFVIKKENLARILQSGKINDNEGM
jgi:serine/threonine protein kinase